MRKIFLISVVVIASVMSSLSPFSQAAESQSLAVGTGSAKFNGLFQTWLVNDTAAATTTNIRLRRSELKLSGSVIEDTRWFVMMDPAKSLKTGAVSGSNDNKILQDLGVAYSITSEFELVAGQFKIPTTAEGLDSSAELPFTERSLVAKTYGDKREPGVMLTYKTSNWKIATMASNGQAANVDDTTANKDLNVRFDWMPIPSLAFGAFTTAPDFSYGTNGGKGRWGVNARLLLDDLTLRAEGVLANDLGTFSRGWVLDAGYQLGDYQPVARYYSLDNSTVVGTEASFGLNYYLSKNNSKIQATYGILNNLSGSNGSPSLAPDMNGTLFTLAFQAAI